MRHSLSAAALALTLLLAPAAFAAPAHHPATANNHAKHKPAAHKKRHVFRHWSGYGFLPGLPPKVAACEREWRYRQSGPHYYGPAWPRF